MFKPTVISTKTIAMVAIIFAFFATALQAQKSDLFISEYCEGSSNNKYIEIYNGTGADVDLTNYLVRKYYSSTSYHEFTLSGTLANGSVYVIASSSAATEIKNKANLLNGNANWNGDDAIILYKNGVEIDIIGIVSATGGSEWVCAGLYDAGDEQTWIRKPSVTGPTTDWALSAGTNALNSQWIIRGQNYYGDLGTYNSYAPAFETITFQDFNAGFGLWTTYNVSSNKNWFIDYGDAEINGYSQDMTSNDWLISPAINLDMYMNEFATFYTQWTYGNNDANDYLKLFYSTDYLGTGNPENATWEELDFNIISTYNAYSWELSGNVDLSDISGTQVYLAFQYYSAVAPRRWNIDQFAVQGNYFSTTGKTKYLKVRQVTPAVPIAGLPFSIEVVSTDANGVPVAVTADTEIDLVQIKGLEQIIGNTQKVLPAGQYSVTFDNLIHPIADVVMVRPTAPNNTQNDTDELEPTRFEFEVSATPTLVIKTYEKGHKGSTHPVIIVEAQNPDGTPNLYYSNYDVTLNINNGMFNGMTTATAYYGVAEFDYVEFLDAVNYQLTASGDMLDNSAPFYVDVNDAPYFEEVIIPNYVKGEGDFFEGGTGNGRMPSYALVKFSNLHPNTTYRFTAGGVQAENVYTAAGTEDQLTISDNEWDAGLNIHYDAATNTYNFYSYPALNLDNQFSTFITGNNETEKTFWVNLIPTNDGSGMYAAGTEVHWVVDLGFETGDLIVRRVAPTPSTNLRLGSGYSEASPFYDDDARLTPKNIVVLRDNLGDVVTTAMVQDEGALIKTSEFYSHQSPYFYVNLEYVDGAFATFVPNSYSGVFQIDEYSNTNPRVLRSWTDTDGTWAGVSTIGTGNEIDFELPRFTAYDLEGSVCAGPNPYMLGWDAQGVAYVDIELSLNGGAYLPLFDKVPAMDSYYAWDIVREVYSSDEIATRDIKLRITSTEHSYISDETNTFNILDAPILTDQSDDAVICEDNSLDENDHVTLGVVATGSFLAFQWYKDGVLIPNANKSTYVISNAKYKDAARYSCEITTSEGDCGSVWSENIPVYVAMDTEITQQAKDRGATVGGTASFKIKAHINGVDPDYNIGVQWYKEAEPVDIMVKDDAFIAGAKSNLLTFINVQPTHFGKYYAVVEGKCDYPSVTSTSVSLTEVAITIEGPEDIAACEGEEVTLSVTASTPSNETLAYQWQKDGEDLMNGDGISGAMTNTLVIANAMVAHSGSYKCVVSAIESDVTTESASATVVINAVPMITSQTESQNIQPNADLTLTVSATGDNLVYNWFLNDAEVQSGSEADYQITAATAADAGDYKCVVENECGVAESEVITITVNDGGISSVNENSSEGYSLSSAIPNPVSNQAVINYYVPAASQVLVKLIDMRGKEIAVLVNQFVAQGEHNLTIDANKLNLTNGTYFYTLQSGNVSVTNSFVIVR